MTSSIYQAIRPRPYYRAPSNIGIPPSFNGNITSYNHNNFTILGTTGATRIYYDYTVTGGTVYSLTATISGPTSTGITLFVRNGTQGSGTVITSASFSPSGETKTISFVAPSPTISILISSSNTANMTGSDIKMTSTGVTQTSFHIFGDSTAVGYNATTTWYNRLISSYTPVRYSSINALGGEDTSQLLGRASSEGPTYKSWNTIFMDRPNTGEPSSSWISNIKQAVSYLTTSHWYVHPPVQDYPDTSLANITEVQATLLSDSFFTSHTLNSSDQAAYIAAMNDPSTRYDGVHDNDTGAQIRANYIKGFMVSRGW